MVKNLRAILLSVAMLLALAPRASATEIDYTLSYALGHGTFGYTVHNDTLGVNLEDFVIYFPDISGPGEYTMLNWLTAPAGWTVSAFEPSAILLNGYVDANSFGGGVLPGGTLSGFEVEFDYSGAGAPGAQFFEIYDSAFNLLDTGWTVPASVSPVVIPESSSWTLYLASGALIQALRSLAKRRHARNRH